MLCTSRPDNPFQADTLLFCKPRCLFRAALRRSARSGRTRPLRESAQIGQSSLNVMAWNPSCSATPLDSPLKRISTPFGFDNQ